MNAPWADWLDDKNVENVFLGKYFRRRECPTCQMVIYEEFDYSSKQLTENYEEHYKEEHVVCKEDPDNCICDKESCGRKCGR